MTPSLSLSCMLLTCPLKGKGSLCIHWGNFYTAYAVSILNLLTVVDISDSFIRHVCLNLLVIDSFDILNIQILKNLP